MTNRLKLRAERVLSSNAVGCVTRHRVRGKRLILAYHGVVPDGESPVGEHALFIQQRDFIKHLDVLSEVADVAPLDRIDEDGDGRPRVAITFDDAYRGAVWVGVRELSKRDLPATIFVAPGRLNGHVFWWDALSHGRIEPEAAVREHAIHALGGSDERVRDWASRTAIPSSDALPDFARTANLDELLHAVQVPGITVGSHTWSHANLAALSVAHVVNEVVRPLDWLRGRFGGKAIAWLAYPYGIDSIAAQHILAAASYAGALRVVGGWHRRADHSAFSRPRLNVPAGLSAEGLRSRLLGAVLA